jgi:uncharacterized DUF497 family protein
LGRFDWDENNIGHIAAHGVIPAEIEEAFARVLVLELREKAGEDRAIAALKTASGRVLQVVYPMRKGTDPGHHRRTNPGGSENSMNLNGKGRRGEAVEVKTPHFKSEPEEASW